MQSLAQPHIASIVGCQAPSPGQSRDRQVRTTDTVLSDRSFARLPRPCSNSRCRFCASKLVRKSLEHHREVSEHRNASVRFGDDCRELVVFSPLPEMTRRDSLWQTCELHCGSPMSVTDKRTDGFIAVGEWMGRRCGPPTARQTVQTNRRLRTQKADEPPDDHPLDSCLTGTRAG
jgi:hypothetical protein